MGRRLFGSGGEVWLRVLRSDPSEKIPPQRHHRYTSRGFDGIPNIAQQHQSRNEKDGERLISFDWAKETGILYFSRLIFARIQKVR
jgi:hypothetical protein